MEDAGEADHVPSDIDTYFNAYISDAFPGSVGIFEIVVGNDTGPPVDFTGAITVTMPIPAGTTFWNVSGTLPFPHPRRPRP